MGVMEVSWIHSNCTIIHPINKRMVYLNYNRKLKMGLVGGGPGAFIGDVHRKAAILDGGVNLVSDLNIYFPT